MVFLFCVVVGVLCVFLVWFVWGLLFGFGLFFGCCWVVTGWVVDAQACSFDWLWLWSHVDLSGCGAALMLFILGLVFALVVA
jgi:hypothetical protein